MFEQITPPVSYAKNVPLKVSRLSCQWKREENSLSIVGLFDVADVLLDFMMCWTWARPLIKN